MASSRGKVIFLVRVQRRERLTTFQMVAKVDSHFVAVFWWMSKTFFTVWANFLVLLNWWMLFNKHNIHNSQRNNYLETDHIVLHPKSAFNASVLSLFFAFFFLLFFTKKPASNGRMLSNSSFLECSHSVVSFEVSQKTFKWTHWVFWLWAGMCT